LHIIKLTRLAGHFEKLIVAKEATLKDDKAKRDKGRDFAADKHHTKAYKFLSAASSPPITYLRRSEPGPAGEAPGTFATEPEEMDHI
jgi:hypothetical protein